MELSRENGQAVRDDSGAYAARKQRLMAAQQARYASLSFAQEQRRLRIHLRRQLLIHGATLDTNPTPSPSPQTLRTLASQEQLRQWRDDAITRDAKRQQCHTGACLIQHYVRKWLSTRQLQELPSSSEFIAIPVTPSTSPQQRFDHTTTTALTAWTSDAPIPIRTATIPSITEPFQVIVELLGARDLASAQTMNLDGAAGVIADVRLVDSSLQTVLGRLETPPLSLALASSDGIQWDDQVLQIGIDPEQLSTEKVLAECVVVVDVSVVKPSAPQMTAVGRLSVSMDLLETPLADKYAMTRWFPLERSSGGGLLPARGELRVSIRFLMRKNCSKNKHGDDTMGDDDVWEPYCGTPATAVDPPLKTAAPKRTPGAQPRKRPSNAPAKPPATTKPPLSPRRKDKDAPAHTSPTIVKTKRIASPVRNRKVEVISPPSSPSSYSSESNAMDSELDFPSPPPKRGQSPRKRGSSAGIVANAHAANKPQRSSLRESMSNKTSSTSTKTRRESAETPSDRWSSVSHDDGGHESSNDGGGDSSSPKKPFLKRKPYKVVFRKLDWSRVGSKTDSGSGGAKGGATTTTTTAATTSATIPQVNGSVRPGSAAPQRGGKSGHAADATNGSDTATTLDAAAVMERLSAVIAQVHASCKVTPQTAPLAQMKYKNERNKLFAPRNWSPGSSTSPDQNQAVSGGDATTEAMTMATTKSPRVDDLLRIQTLWMELHADADGAVYAQRLAEALQQPQPPSGT